MKKSAKDTDSHADAKSLHPSGSGREPNPTRKCVICGSPVAPISDESLCWVCRRLKVSAWSEGADAQMFTE